MTATKRKMQLHESHSIKCLLDDDLHLAWSHNLPVRGVLSRFIPHSKNMHGRVNLEL